MADDCISRSREPWVRCSGESGQQLPATDTSFSWHADERCEEREISDWQIVDGFAEAELVRERPSSKPNPSVVVRQRLADGAEVEAVWSYLVESRRALLVTVYFLE